MVLFRPFLAYLTSTTEDLNGKNWTPEAQAVLEMAARKCIDSSKKTVEIIYETFRQHTFFRCWYVAAHFFFWLSLTKESFLGGITQRISCSQ